MNDACVGLHDVRHVGIEELPDPLQMIGQPQIVVREVGDYLAASTAQRLVSILPSKPGSLGQVQHHDPFVVQGAGCSDAVVGAPVGDDDDLEGLACLPERAFDREEQVGSPVVGRDDDGDRLAHRTSFKRRHQLYVPIGFAHGFCVTSDLADVMYKIDSYYDGRD